MMEFYSLNRMAQIEHQQRIHELPTIPEFGYVIAPKHGKRPLLWVRLILISLLHLVTN